MSLVWRSARKEKIYSAGISTHLPLKPCSSIIFKDLVMASRKSKSQRYFTTQPSSKKSKSDKCSKEDIKTLEKKVINKLDQECSDSDSIVCQLSPLCEVDEMYYNFLTINKYYCVNAEYRTTKSLHGVNNSLFNEKAQSFIKYHFDQGLNDRNTLCNIYSVGSFPDTYRCSKNEVMLMWKTYALSAHSSNYDVRIVDCGCIRELDKGLEELCTRNYLRNLADHFKLLNGFAVVVANGTMGLNSVHVVPEANMILMETNDERKTVELKNRNLMDMQLPYSLLSKVYYECNYKVVDFEDLIKFSECCPLVIRANDENIDILNKFKGNVVKYAEDCDSPLNFMISFVLKYFGTNHFVFNCSSILLTCNVLFDFMVLLKQLCTLLKQIFPIVKDDSNTIEYLFFIYVQTSNCCTFKNR